MPNGERTRSTRISDAKRYQSHCRSIPATSLTCRILVVFPKTWFFDQTAFFFVACLFLVFYKFRRVKPALGSNDPVTSQLCQAVPQGNRFRSSSWLHITLRLEMPLFPNFSGPEHPTAVDLSLPQQVLHGRRSTWRKHAGATLGCGWSCLGKICFKAQPRKNPKAQKKASTGVPIQKL